MTWLWIVLGVWVLALFVLGLALLRAAALGDRQLAAAWRAWRLPDVEEDHADRDRVGL